MIPMINDGYKPTFEGNALSAYFNGLNAANADNSAQEEILRQYLANQRELQIAPLDIGIKQWEAASAQDKLNDPEYRKWALQGYTGQMKSQDAAGKKAQQNWKGEANLVDRQNNNKLTRERVLSELYDLKTKGEGGTIGFPMQAQQGLDLPTPPVFGNMRTESSLKNVMQNQPGEGMGAPRDTSYDRVELTRALANPKLSPENRKALEAELARLNAGTLGTGMDAPPPLGSVPPNVAGVTQQQVVTNDSPLVQQPPRRNWGISPGSARAEQLMSILVDTPELRTDLIKGDQKADSAEYMKMLDTLARIKAAEEAARGRAGAGDKPVKTAEEGLARVITKKFYSGEISYDEYLKELANIFNARNAAKVQEGITLDTTQLQGAPLKPKAPQQQYVPNVGNSIGSLESKVKESGVAYEPDKYDYRITEDGKVQRKPKGN